LARSSGSTTPSRALFQLSSPEIQVAITLDVDNIGAPS
jgi:hypothetical protein